jgi:hypothetical protein
LVLYEVIIRFGKRPQLERALSIAYTLNAGRIPRIGELCQLEANLKAGKSIADNIAYLQKCSARPGINQVLEL